MRRSGVCTGKDTGINQTESLVLGIKNKPGYRQIKRADTPKMNSTSRSMTEKDSILQSPRRLRAKYTHRTNFVYALCISPCRELFRRQADKFVNRCLCTYSQQSRREPERRMLIGRHSFIRQNKLSDVAGRIDYISNPKRQEHLYKDTWMAAGYVSADYPWSERLLTGNDFQV